MKRSALIVWGGWDGHEPRQVGEVFARILKARASRSRCPKPSTRSSGPGWPTWT